MHCVCRNKFKARMWPSWEATRLSGPVETATPLNQGLMSPDKGQLALDLENILQLLCWSHGTLRGDLEGLRGSCPGILDGYRCQEETPNLERALIQLTTLQGRFGDSGEEPVICCEALVLAEGWRWEWLGRDGGSSWKGYPREINQTLLQGKVHPQTERTHKSTPWKRVTKPMSWA